jgi:hypothetical protein
MRAADILGGAHRSSWGGCYCVASARPSMLLGLNGPMALTVTVLSTALVAMQ